MVNFIWPRAHDDILFMHYPITRAFTSCLHAECNLLIGQLNVVDMVNKFSVQGHSKCLEPG